MLKEMKLNAGKKIKPERAITTYCYDLFGREISITNALEETTFTTYHKGEGTSQKEVTDPRGVKLVTTYDPFGNPLLEQRYDSIGKL